MRSRAISARKEIASHSWVLSLVESLRDPGPAVLRHHEAVLACLRRDGFSIAGAGLAFTVIDSYVYGFVLQELNLPFDENDGFRDAAVQLEADTANSYPNLVELLGQSASTSSEAETDAFDTGLELVLDAVATLREGVRVGSPTTLCP